MKTRTKTASFPKTLSPAFREYADLLVQLDHLMRTGKDDSVEAEDLRSRMDAPWYAMTEEEIQLADELSAQLYELAGEDRMRPLPEGKPLGRHAFADAIKARDWYSILSTYPSIVNVLLKGRQKEVLLAGAWEWAGLPKVALCFWRHAINRGEPLAKTMMPAALYAAGERDQAIRVAKSFIEELSAHDRCIMLCSLCPILVQGSRNDRERRQLAWCRNELDSSLGQKSSISQAIWNPGKVLVAAMSDILGRHQDAENALYSVAPEFRNASYHNIKGVHELCLGRYAEAAVSFREAERLGYKPSKTYADYVENRANRPDINGSEVSIDSIRSEVMRATNLSIFDQVA